MPIDYHSDSRYDHLSPDQVRRHFEEEHKLREHLLASPKDKRAEAFVWAYDELFRRCPWHPALTECSGADAPEIIERRIRNFLPLLPKDRNAKVLEIGCGMGELMVGLANARFNCTGLDVSKLRVERLRKLERSNLHFVHGEGSTLPFQDATFDVAISMQLFEHLHPEDAPLHLREVARILKPGGCYFLETPNKLIGPGDVSRFFCETAEGFHLREYTIRELRQMFLRSGYERVDVLLRWRRRFGGWQASWIERIWNLLPKNLRRRHSLGLHNPLYIARTSAVWNAE
jgi:SAM-dependent methyltransferase